MRPSAAPGASWSRGNLDVLIRRATFEDTASMGAVWLRAALKGYDGIFPPEAPKPTAGELIDRWRRVIAGGPPSTMALVACRGTGAVVGTVAAMSDVDSPYNAQLRRLYVDPGHWGRGIGRRLHDAALDHLRTACHPVVALWVLEGNVRARSMYERWGWRATPARQPAYPGVDEILYVRSL